MTMEVEKEPINTAVIDGKISNSCTRDTKFILSTAVLKSNFSKSIITATRFFFLVLIEDS